MQFDPLHPTHSAIIEVLAKEAELSMSDLFKKVATEHAITISTQSLYRIVGQMVDAGILLREKGKLFLSLKWLKETITLIQEAEETYIHNSESTLSIPQEDGDYRHYNANSLLAMEPLWDQIILKINAQSEEQNWYEYGSHPYHVLAMPTEEIPFYKSLKTSGIGNSSFLDTYGTQLLTTVANTAITDTPPFPKEGHILLVCGSYIISVVIPPAATDHLGSFYRTTNRIEEFEVELYNNVFTMKTPCKITVRKSTIDAGDLRAKFKPYFT